MSEQLEDNVVDHIVLATPDVAATSAWVAEATGVEPSVGGPHLGRGTHNTLCSLGPGLYLEIIGPDPEQPDPIEPRPFGVDALDHAGVATWCVRRRDLGEVVRAGEELGLSFLGPVSMSRQAPDELLSWELLFPAIDSEGGLVPFFIDWGDSTHPSTTAASGLHLRSITGAHPEPQRVLRLLLGLDVTLEVHAGPTPGITIEIEGPDGQLTLPPAQTHDTADAAPEDTLRAYRNRIDVLDDQLIRLLAERFEITKAVGAYKAAAGLPAADPAREAEQVARLRAIASEVGMDPAFSEQVFRLIVDEVIRHHLRHAEGHE